MASQWLKARQTKYGAYAGIYLLVVLAILVVVNFLANRYNKSFDTTSNKRYSLSEQTQKIVQGLKQNATITYYNQSTRFQEGKDLLDEYANLSTKIHVAYVDPDKSPELARAAGIRQLRHRGGAGGRQERDCQRFDGRGHHRRLHSRSQGYDPHCLLRDRQWRASDRQHRARWPFPLQGPGGAG